MFVANEHMTRLDCYWTVQNLIDPFAKWRYL